MLRVNCPPVCDQQIHIISVLVGVSLMKSPLNFLRHRPVYLCTFAEFDRPLRFVLKNVLLILSWTLPYPKDVPSALFQLNVCVPHCCAIDLMCDFLALKVNQSFLFLNIYEFIQGTTAG